MSRPFRPLLPGAPCPVIYEPDESYWLDTNCNSERCTVSVEQDGCTLIITPLGCTLSATDMSLRASIDAAGELNFLPSPGLGQCTELPARAGAERSITCSNDPLNCQLELYKRSQPTLVAEPMSLVESCPPPTAFQEKSPLLQLDDFFPLAGCVSGLVVQEDRLVVARHEAWRPFVCREPIPSQLLFIDPQTMVITSTAPAPPCLSHLAEAPDGSLIGVAYDEGATLVRLSDKGQIGAATRIDHPPTNHRLFGTSLMIDDAREEILVLLSDESVQSPGFITRFNIDLEQTGTSTSIVGELRSATFYGPGRIALSNRQPSGSVVLMETSTLSIITSISLHSERRVSNNAGFIAANEGRLTIAASGQRPGLWSVGGGPQFRPAELDQAVFYEAVQYPWATEVAAWDSELMVVGHLSENPETEARAALFETQTSRFLPGSISLGGTGVVSILRKGPPSGGANTRVIWALLPWSGVLSRITPR